MKEAYLPDNQVLPLLNIVEREFDTFVFTLKGILRYASMSGQDKEKIPQYLRDSRSPFPAKSFFLPAKEEIAQYGKDCKSAGKTVIVKDKKPFALVNLRNCDLEALEVLDQIFLQGDYIDPFYEKRRRSTLIVSVDCSAITEFCFCTTLGYQPYAVRAQGINLSPLPGGFIVGTDTPLGESVLDKMGATGAPAQDEMRREVDRIRQQVLEQLRNSNEKFATPHSYHDILKMNPPSERWNDLFNNCVECAGCTNVCPSCYCFYMFDQARYPDRGQTFERLRSWDSCLLADYSRMAGIAGMKPNPRARIRERYANRFQHKYLHHFDTYKRYGCTGCGRCTQSCMGTTDPREVMRVLGQ